MDLLHIVERQNIERGKREPYAEPLDVETSEYQDTENMEPLKDGRFYAILLSSFALIVLAICQYIFDHI